MQIIAICNSKGGVGKTTLTASLAVEAAASGDPVAILDTDPSSSLSEWYQRRHNTSGPDQPELLRDCDTVAEALERIHLGGVAWKWLFIDTPPGEVEEGEAAMRAANFTIVPIRPSALDIMSSELAVESAREVADGRFMVVLNAVLHSDGLENSTRAYLMKASVPIADTTIRYRKPHIVAMTTGRTAREWEGGTKKTRDEAASDIAALWQEIMHSLGGRR